MATRRPGKDVVALPETAAELDRPLDLWVLPPDTSGRRKRGRGTGGRPHVVTPYLVEWVDQFSHYLRKQRGRTEGGVKTYRWNLEQFLVFVRAREGRVARVGDLTAKMAQAWLDDMAAGDLGPNTLRCRLATLSSFCGWLVKREVLVTNPVGQLDRPPRQVTTPAVPAPALMDALVEAARRRERPRDLAIFLLLRYTGMRRGSVAGLRVRHLDPGWGLRDVQVKGGRTQDLPLPDVVTRFLGAYVERVLAREGGAVTPEMPLFWSSWGKRTVGKTRAPMTGKNIWRLCKTYGRLIGAPDLKPHDLRHGVAVEVLGQRHDLEEVRALLGHARIDTTQLYTRIRPPQLKRAVAFYEAQATKALAG